MMRPIAALFGLLAPSLCFANCSNLSDKPTVGDLLNCVSSLEIAIDKLVQENSRLKDEVQTMPSGAVVAFDSSKGCPVGWDSYSKGISRMIVGAGNPKSDNQSKVSGKALTARSFGEIGGEESVRLTIEEMPKHDHGGLFGGDGNKAGMMNEFPYHAAGYQKFTPEGGTQPHNNMSPYIALFYCVKI